MVRSCAWSLTWSLTWEKIVVTDTQTAKQTGFDLYLGCLKKRLKLQVGFTEIIFVVVGTQVKVEFKETVAYFEIKNKSELFTDPVPSVCDHWFLMFWGKSIVEWL